MTQRRVSRLVFLLLLSAGLAGGAMGESSQRTTLGNDGALYQVRSLTYGEVYADAADSAADYPVLGIEVIRSGQARSLLVVPGTDGPETEQAAFLAYEASSNTLYLTWERRVNNLHSQILLASYHDGQWSEVIGISDQRFSLKYSPQVAITRDSYVSPADGSIIQRTVLHTIWFEDRASGGEVVYSPIVLINGTYVGHHERVDLSTLFAADPDLNGEGTSPDQLPHVTPVIQALAHGHRAAAGYLHPLTGRLVTLQLAILPGELSAISDDLRSHIIDIGHRYDLEKPEEVRRFAEDLRSHIIDIGARTKPEVSRYVAGELRSHIIDIGARYSSDSPEEVRRMAGELRSHIIDIGFSLEDKGPTSGSETRSVTLDLLSPDGSPGAINPVMRVEKALSLALPELESSELTLHLSSWGNQAALSWQDGNQLRYHETVSEGWSEVHALRLEDSFSAERAQAVLNDHLQDR